MEQIKTYHCAKRTCVVLRISMICYLLMAVLCFLQLLFGGLLLIEVIREDGFFANLIWNKAHYTGLLFAIEALLFAYGVYGIIDTLAVIRRLKTVYLTIAGSTVSGISLIRPRAWGHGSPFELDASSIVSIGMLDVKLHGRSSADAVLINTAEQSYVLPALEDIAAVRKALELARDRAGKTTDP